jgi:hypothetical protein
MKVKQLLLAVAGVLMTATAFAGTSPAQISAARSANNLDEAWVSGASAPTFMLYNGYLAGCDAGSMTVYATGTNTGRVGSVGNYMAYACTRGGKVSVLYHTVNGGSLFAYLPHTTGAFENRLREIGGNTCTLAAPAAGSIAETYNGCALTTATAYPVTVDAGPRRPAGGFSDVEASAFGAIAGDVAANGTEFEALIGQAFGVAVNTSLYRALQTAQGINVAADPNFAPENAPNITSAQYASIVSAGGGYQTDWSPIVGAAGAGKKIVLARRVVTSGTQGSSNIHFLKNPCSNSEGGALSPATAIDSTPSFQVIENSGTGNVKEALTTAQGNGDFAIGIMSMENDWRVETRPTRQEYRFVKLDGVHPEAGSQQGNNANGTPYYTARQTSINGDYQFHMEMRYYVANTATGFAASIIPEIVGGLANPADCSETPRGLTLNPLTGSACGPTVVVKGTNFGNNCKAPVLFF